MSEVSYAAEGRVAVITLNRPEVRNAIDGAMARGIEAAIDRLEDDPEVWVGVLAAAPPVFCAGADLKVVGAGNFGELVTERGGFAGIATRDRAKPIVAAVEGAALGGGLEIVLSCDLAVASAAAQFGLPEVRRSLVAAAGGLTRLARRIPRAVAMEYALTGGPIYAAQALRWGLVNEVCPPRETLPRALALAGKVAANAPLAVRAARRVVAAASDLSEEEAWRLSDAAMTELMATEDFREGLASFFEKREPRWSGR